MYTQSNGSLIWHKKSFFRIDPETNLILKHSSGHNTRTMKDVTTVENVKEHFSVDTAGKTKSIHLGKENTTAYSATKAEELLALLSKLAKNLDLKTPVTPGLNVGLVKTAAEKIKSKIVKLEN